MSNEIFPPTESELDTLIQDLTKQMETAETKKEYDLLHDRLKDLKERKRQLIIKNQTI